MQKEYVVIAIHGEGDQDTVNSLQKHRNSVEIKRLTQINRTVPEALKAEPNEAPDVIVVLRDEHHHHRIELPLEDWEQVDQWKKLVGFDSEKRQWKTGGSVKVTFGGKK